MSYTPLVSVIILNWDGKDIIESAVSSVLKSDYPDIEAIVVDNISTDGSIELLSSRFGNDRRVKVIVTEKNFPFAVAHNIGIRNAKGEYVLIINNDNQLDRDCIKNLISGMRGGIEVCSPKIIQRSGKIDFIGAAMDRWGYAYGRGHDEIDRGQYDNDDFFYAGYWMFKKTIVQETGFFDEDISMGWDDLDFSWRIRLTGRKIALVPTAIMYHLGSHTVKKLRTKYFCHYHMRKNRIAGLIKNYGLCNLVSFLPGLLFFYLLVSLKELILDRDARLAFTSVKAVCWNIWNLRLLIKKRSIVQKLVRKVPDREILSYIYKKSVLIEYFLKPKFKGVCVNG